jgi:glycine/D-amino acid oxidase-like deaminating enzyme
VTSTQQLLRLGRPVWMQKVQARTERYNHLAGTHTTRVAIVGGGITGALIAHAFASTGIDTVVLEAGLVGQGSTAASSALLLQEPDLELTKLASRYGTRTGRRVWEMGAESVRALVRLLRRLKVTCDLEQLDAIYYATDAIAVARLRTEYDLRQRCGFDATWLGPGALRDATGIPGRGAIRTQGSAQFDPYRACRGILDAAVAGGAQVFERSEVRRIATERDGLRLQTRTGTLHCEHVVIATGYATAQFRPLAGRFRMYRTYVLATEPIQPHARRDLGLSDVMVWDTERPYHYARWTKGHRLLLGGCDLLLRPGARRRQQFATAIEQLRDYFETRLPALSTIKTEFAWEGLFATTPDSLPYIGPHRRYPRHWFALGYGGNGMTFAFLAARLLLERLQGRSSRDHALFEFGRMHR